MATISDDRLRELEKAERTLNALKRRRKTKSFPNSGRCIWKMAEECLEIADDAKNDWELRQNKDGSKYEAQNPEVVNRSRLRIETRLKLLAKWNPKKYGEKMDLNHGGSVGVQLISDIPRPQRG